jgi:hypothetical protein
VDENDQDVERFESIPWAALLPEENGRRNRWLSIAGAVLIALVVGFVTLRVVNSGPAETVVTLGAPTGSDGTLKHVASTVEAAGTERTAPEPEPAAEPAIESVVPESRVFSEADLLAVAPDGGLEAAVMRAEWFVVDFFTVDDDANGNAVRGAMGTPPTVALPHDLPTGVSYVEWARAYAVESLPGSAYRVSIAFRTLSGPKGEAVVRRPVRAVAVEVAADASGATAVLDLPQALSPPVVLPALPTTERCEGGGIVSAAVESAALQIAGASGADSTVIGGAACNGGWRVAVEVTDASGMTFPMIAWVPGP